MSRELKWYTKKNLFNTKLGINGERRNKNDIRHSENKL